MVGINDYKDEGIYAAKYYTRSSALCHLATLRSLDAEEFYKRAHISLLQTVNPKRTLTIHQFMSHNI